MVDLILMLAILAPGGHPKLYETPQDVVRAKGNVQRFGWAANYYAGVRKGADKWAGMSDTQLRDLVPPPGSIFAYGFSGCPACNAGWSSWGAGGIADIEKPGVVTCPKCKKTFPDADHPDSGKGWHDPKNGKTYYFIGVYNAHVAQEITLHALQWLSIAYAISGDRKYSHAAAVLFDRLADTYPTATVGSFDYPMQGNHGRLERPQYQVARVLVHLADNLDLLSDSPDFAAPSASGKGSVREHVENDIIRDGGKYCYDQAMDGHMGLTNGEADYVRGSLAAGLMLDDKQLIGCAVTEPCRLQNFLDNCLDRDGQYYETSVGYSDHCLGLYVDMAEMLYNMRTAEYPNGIDLYKHPKLQKALFAAQIDINCFGHTPRFGDWGPDTGVITSDSRYSVYPYAFSEFLTARAADEPARDYWAAARDFICDGDVESRRSSKDIGEWENWLFWHAEPAAKPKTDIKFEPHALLGGRGVVTLRSGEGAKGRAALLRYGPSMNHGHLDDLNVNLFGLGRELTYDLGYALGSAHVQVGWAKTTASHNLVVVNEKEQMAAPRGGGSAYYYVDQKPVRATEASSEASYASEGVKTYRRTMVMVDVPGGSYLVDIFRVAGGNRHDLMWHFIGKLDGVTGAEMGPVQAKGSLAGPEYDWGQRVGPSGYLDGCADKGDYWNPPPGNGYGFLYNVRHSASLDPECVTAGWAVGEPKEGTVSLRLLPEPGTELVTAHAPGISPTAPQADYAILRRKGADLTSAFVSVVEASDSGGAVRSARRLGPIKSGSLDAACQQVAVEIKTSAGTDYILSSVKPKRATFLTSNGDAIEFDGQFGFLRVVDGRVARGVIVGGTLLRFGAIQQPSASNPEFGELQPSYTLQSSRTAYEASVAAVDYEHAKLTLDCEVAQGIAYISRNAYSHSSPYRVKAVEGRVVTLDGDLVLGRGQIGKDKPSAPDVIANVVPLPAARLVTWKESGYFRGKLIRNDRTGETSTIITVDPDLVTVHVKDPAKFAAGDTFTIYDTQPGDTLRVPVIAAK